MNGKFMNEEKLKEVIADTFDIDESEICEDTSRDTLGNWDSLNHLRLVTALEQDLGISFSMDEINTMDSYPRILGTVTKHLNVK